MSGHALSPAYVSLLTPILRLALLCTRRFSSETQDQALRLIVCNALSQSAFLTTCFATVVHKALITLHRLANILPYRSCDVQETFENPVRAADGQAYERSAITDWLGRQSTSPLTNMPLKDQKLQAIPGAKAFMQKLVSSLAQHECSRKGLYTHLLAGRRI